MKRLFGIFIGMLGMIVLVFSAVVASQSNELVVVRRVEVKAEKQAIFPYVSDYANFQLFNPWRELDPMQSHQVSTPPSGRGAYYRWAGNSKVGAGEMTVDLLAPPHFVEHRVVFTEPLPSRSDMTFRLSPLDEGTEVEWSYTLHADFWMKAGMLVMDMDAMLGSDLERGLSRLKTVVETSKGATYSDTVPQVAWESPSVWSKGEQIRGHVGSRIE
jgi:hypothetical protein